MSTSIDFIKYVAEQLNGAGYIRYKKMFGEYMVYVNEKPVLLVADNTVYVKMLPCVAELLGEAERGYPYPSAKEHYILNIDDAALSKDVIAILEPNTPFPKPRQKMKKN